MMMINLLDQFKAIELWLKCEKETNLGRKML